jgi:ubiquinone/menaquinone biosynthesis C-methylase UbiE
MELSQAIKLIDTGGLLRPDSKWADLGCGSGLFTFALANLLSNPGTIYAIDKSNTRLNILPNPNKIAIIRQNHDFEHDILNLPKLEGILIANSLHFVANKFSLIQELQRFLKPEGFFLIVEYDTNKSNAWVPFPMSFQSLKQSFEPLGFVISKINETPSVYHSGNIYAARMSPK